MFLKLLALFVLIPLIELALLLVLANYTSLSFTLVVVIVTGVIGTLLARAQGWRTFRRIQDEAAKGKLPADALIDAALIFCAGALLLTPGLLTDAFGLSLLIPFFRTRYRVGLARWARRHFNVQHFESTNNGQHSEVVDSYVVEDPSEQDDHKPFPQ